MVVVYCFWLAKNDSIPAALRNETSYSELSPPAIIAIFRFILTQ